MTTTFEEFQKLTQDGFDAAVKSFGAVSHGAQTLAAELSDYAQKAVEEGTAATEKLLGARSPENFIAAQSDYMRTAYESFVTRSTKIGSLYADVAKDAYKPIEAYFSNAKGPR